MKQITCFLLVFFFMISSTMLFSQQPTSLDKLKMEQMEKYVNSDNGPSVKATAQPVEGEHYTSYATYYPSRSELYNNGPFITHPGGGAGGKDASAVQTNLGMSAYGPNVNHNMSPGNYYYLADDFEVVGTWNLESIKFYGYQTGSGTTSTFTGIYVQIWDGAPNAGGAVVWGDLTTNRMLSTQFSDVYRVLDTGLTNTDRPIMEIIADVSGCTLNSGTYWVQWGLTGSAASGPWGVAITILGQTTTGNGLQAISTGWQNWQDSGTSTGQGGVFIIEGTAGSQPTKDVGVQAILAPNTGVNLTGAEEVKFIIKNFGTEDQSNIPWTVTMTGQGSASFNGTYAGPLAAGAAIEITAGTANLSGYGIYNFEACVNLAGDENPANNCKTKDVENKEPSLCVDNLYSSGCTSGDGLTSWDFANINVPNIPCSGTPPWYHDYRDMVHQVVAGQTYVLTVTSGYSSTNFDVWIDFNDDLILSNDDELILNDGLCSTGNTPYTFNITIPADAPVGMHVIRYRTNYYSLVTDPCATYTFGNCCDFTIQIVGTTTAGPAPENLQANLINNTTVGLTWEAPQELGEWLQYCGDNNEGLGITDGGTFIVAARWDNLDSYVGKHVKQFALFPRSDLGATFAVRIYKGANAQTLLVDQPLTGLIMDEWNIITLDSPVLIEASTEYWAGYEVTHVEGDYPVGIDAGPAVAGYGDMISLDDGVTWNTLSGFGLDYNFNVKIFVAPGSDGPVAQPIAKVSHNNFNNATLSLGNLKPATNSSFIPTRGPSSYKVFRDGDMIAQGITVLEYTDSGLAQGTYTYTVKAVYPDGDSDPSNEATIYVPGSAIGPVWSVDPSQLIENHATNNLTTSKYLTITNQGDEILTWDLTIQRASTAGPDVVLDPEWVAEQYAQRAALEGDPLSERNISPSRGGFMDNILEDFDLQFEYPVGVGGGEAGIEADANYIYTSKWNGTDFYRYDYDGTYVGSFAIPGAGQIRDLAYDGTYFYGGQGSSTVYIMDFVGQTLIGQFSAPTAVRAIAWDDGEEGLWANNWSTTITLFDLQGAVLGTIPNAGDESFYGFAYDHQGPYLWGYGQSGLNNNQLYKYALPSGSLELTHDVFPMLSLVASGDIAGGLAFQPDIVTGFNTLLGLVQNVCLWGIEMGNTTLFDIDVGVSSIVSPNSGVNLGSSEPVVIKIKNHGVNSVSNIPWSVNMTGQGSASFNGTYSGSLAPGADVEISVGTVNLSAYGTYNFEACTSLSGDQNPGNDCKTKPVTNSEPSLCVDNLYSSGCSLGDGLTSWDFVNINVPNIPCSGTPPWYHDYRDMVHEVEAGQTYVLTVTAGYTNTYFDVWIDFNDDLVLNNADELILNDGVCATANTPYTFNITIPADAPGGSHVIRYRTNWASPVTDPCNTYSYGNCCDFKIQIGGGTTADWLSAPVTNGSVNPGQSSQIEVVFNSNGLPSPSVKNGNLIFTTNAPGSPHDVPATLNVGSAIGPVWSVNPTELIENHATNNLITSKYLTVTNQGDETLTWDLAIQRASTAGPDVVLDPELVAEQYAQRAALEGDPFSERNISPSRGGFMDNILEDFDLQFEYPVGVGGGEAGIEADANYIYTSKWNGTDFYRYDYDGTYVGSFAIPGAGQIRDLAYDGTYFYGGQGSSTVYIMDFVGQTLIGQFSAPTAVRAIAWDDGEEGLWANNWSTTITLFDLQGAVLGTIPNAGDESFYGFAYDHQGPYLWGYGQSGPNNNQLYKYALPSGSLELTHDVFPMLSLVASGDIAGGLAFQPDIVTGFNTLLGLVQNVCLWGIEMGNTTLFDIDVGVSSIVSPNSGVNLGSSEPVVIKIKNHGVNSVSNIPWSVNMTGQGSASFNGTYSGSLAPGADVEISVGTVNLSAYGTYNFEACTSLSGDQNPGNDCKTKPVTNSEPSLCVDNLYSSGCSLGDGLTSWDFVNINVPNIPCSGTPPWYHDYRDMVHEVEAGQTYVLTVTAGYTNTYFDVWIDFNDDLVLNNADELILNDGVCATANTPYTFNITIPADAPGGSHVIRYRTNWASPVTDPCNTYSYGNCCDFKIQIGGGTTVDWLSAPVTSGSVDPGQSSQIEVVFNSDGLPVPSVKNGNLIFTTNAPGSPHDVPATLNVGGGPAIVFDPTALTENHAQPNTITTQTLNVTNNTGDPITFNIDIQRASTAGPDVVLDPEWVAEQYAMRQAAEGAILSLGKTVPGGASPNMTDDEIIRWDDGVNADAIGLTNGGTFYVAAYFPVSTMGQYSGMKLNQVEIFVYDVPTSMVLRINGQGTATSPGPLLHSQPLTNLTGMTWHMIDLTDQVDITGEDLWIGYEVTHNSGVYAAGCDGGPAVAGFGDMISMDGTTYQSMATAYGLNYNWNIAGYLIQGTTFAKDVGVQIISTPNTGVNLTGAEVVKFTIKNYGTDAQSNIPWTVTMTGQGSASLNGTYAGPLAAGATAEITAGTANLSAYGIYNFEACTNLAGDEYPNNNCKTKAVENKEPSLCIDNLYSSGCSLGDGLTSWDFVNINVPNIPCSGTPPWYHDYRDMVHEVEAGQTYVLTVTAGYTNTYFDVWIDFNDDLVLNNADELILNDGLCATANTPYTFDITIPADMPSGAHVLRYRTNWSQPVTDPCATYSYGNCCDFKIQSESIIPAVWLTADPLTGTILPGETFPVDVTFNSTGLQGPITKTGVLSFLSNAPGSPHDVPATLVVGSAIGPVWSVNPTELIENHATNNLITSKYLTVTNQGDETLTWDLAIQRASTAGPDVVLDPEWVAEQYAMRQAAEGAILSLGKTVPGGASPNMTDDEIIRWDDGVNADAIGLTNGGTFYVAAYFPVSTMGQYSGMKLNQVEIFVYDVPTSMVLRINGQGTATTPGPLLHSQPLTNLTGMTWHMIDLTDQVDITGEDLWIGYEVTHNSGVYAAGCDGGPAVAGFGDMISMDGTTYESMATAYGLNYNWNIAGYLIQGTTFAKDVGVQIISSPNTGVNLTGAEVVKFTIKNYGTDAQSNIPWTVTMTGQGSASLNGTYAGPLAAGATAEITAGTANLSAYGIYNFEACTNLAGDEYPNNNCKTKAVENKEPSLCIDNLYSSGCSLGDGLTSWDFVNINVPNIPCSGTPPWYHDYRDMVHEVEAGQTYVLTVTAGYTNTYFDVWIDFNDDLVLNNADELILNDGLCATANTPYTFDITIPADMPSGAHVLRYRTNWSQPVTDPCATYSFGNCCDFKIQIGGGTPWLSAPVLSGSVAPGQSEDIEVVFNSDGLPVPSVMNGNLIFTTNAPGSPHNVPATLNVGGGSTIVFDPTALIENHATPNTITTQTLNVTNNTGAPITFNIDIQRASTAGPDIEVDPEWVAEQYAQRAALVGDPFSERHISPSRGGFMDNILEEFDLQFEYPVGVGGGEAGIEADANYIYTSKWNGSDFYRYDHDGTYIGSFAIPGAGQIRDLAYDGTYFYGGQGSSTVYIMDFVGQTLIGQFSAPTAVRAIAWDDGEEGLWANNWSTTITLFDLQGAVLGTIPNAGDESFYGFAYDHQGPYLWGYGQSGPNNNQLYKYALPGGSLELTHDVFPMLSLVASGDIAGGLAFQPDIVTGFNTLLGLVQNVCLWGIEMGNTTIFDIDVGVSSIVSPNSGVNLGSSEPVVIKIKNHGTNSVSNIPWSVNMTGQGSASFNGTYSGSLAPGADVEISVGTVNLSAYGTYNFEACTSLSGDQNPSNDCKTKPVTNSEPSLCVDNLYSSGCSLGDGLTSWDFANINVPNIPCSGTPPWYHDYRDMVHEVEAGQTYVLTVTAGYTNTYFDVWIDFNDDLVLNNADELILNDGVCATANTPYTFNITIPADAPGGSHVIRYRTNWASPVTDPCNTYSYGNCCDFKIQIGGDNPWLSANPLNGTINPGQSFPVTVTFNSTGLQSPSTKIGALHFSSNAPGSPHTVPATLTVGGGDFVVTPSSLTETHSNPPQMTEQNLTVQNNSQSAVTWSIEINTNDAGPDVVLDPEWVAEQYAQRAALVGDPFSERHISPSRGGFMDNILEEFDLQFEYPVGVGGGEAGIEADANYIYTSKWNGSDFYRYDHDGTYIGSFAIPGAGQIRDLAYDGTYFYGGQGSSTVYIMDFVGQTLIGQFSAPTAVRAIAWDDGEEGLWANNWSTTITLFDLQGAVLGTIPNAGDESFYGFAYDHQGPYLWGYGQSGPNNNQLYKYALPGGSLELTHDVFPMLSLVASGDIAGGLAFQPDIVTGFNTLLGLVQNVCLWGIEMGNTTIFDIDVGVSSIVSPNSGVNLGSSEPVVIKIKNHGTNSVSNIPWSVNMTGQGSASFNGTYSGSLAPGADVEISVGTVNLSVHGTYNFEACTSLSGDQNPSNDCKTKPVTNSEPSLCIDNLYSTGCYSFGDGLLSWQLSNINIDIPCLNANDWYHDYRDMVHEVEAGQTYVLTVTAGYTDTYFDVWIDFNNDLVLNNADELILNDAVCATANTPYTFNITIPNNAPGGSHVIRYRTNWSQPVTDPCNTYSYGNCCDFTVQIGGVPPQSWLTAEPMSGTLSPGQSGTVKVKFNSAGLDFGTYTGSVIFNNNSSTPVVTVPVTLIVEQGCPLPPPTDLTLQQTGYNPNVVQLTWVAPEEPGGVIRWDNGINNDGIGLVNGGTFAVAAKWNPDQLTQHVGLYLKQVDIFPRSATATYIIKVWTSATVSQPVVSQSATVVSEQWNTITLTNPVQIEAGKPLYIGYETTHAVSEYPAGCDSGPAIANFGDLISTGGGAWVSMSTQYGLDYNWNIAGIIGIGTDGAAPAVPIVITPNPGVSYGSPVAGNLGKPNNAKWVNTSRALVGYDIKRDGQVIGSVGPTVTTYTDSNVQGGTRIYNVGAHYTECTAWSDPATINVFVTELSPDATTLRIYPNPASETVNIESTTIKQIIIVNNLGQVVYDSPFNNDYVQINTSNLRKGMYVIFIRTAGTTFTEKLIIK